jgi:hypothetical protein
MIKIISTKFENITDGTVTYGYRIYDDNDYDFMKYGNNMVAPEPDNMKILDYYWHEIKEYF